MSSRPLSFPGNTSLHVAKLLVQAECNIKNTSSPFKQLRDFKILTKMATEVTGLFFMTQGNLIRSRVLNHRRLASSILLMYQHDFENHYFMEVHLIYTCDACQHKDSKSVYFSALKMEAASYFRNVQFLPGYTAGTFISVIFKIWRNLCSLFSTEHYRYVLLPRWQKYFCESYVSKGALLIYEMERSFSFEP